MKKRILPNMPKQSLGEVCDKISILALKVFYGEEDAIPELNYLTKGLDMIKWHPDMLVAALRLAEMNTMIWNLENEMRKGGEDKFTIEEIGRRAIQIRDLNKKRVLYKNKLNEMSGLGFREFKIRHRSQ